MHIDLDIQPDTKHRVSHVVMDLASIDPTELRRLRGADAETARSILLSLLAQLPKSAERVAA